uniref:SFRICE_007846 n=1 Tax=Spodoptera frugiperda TaxID=7108 RepID=A0A2H1VJE5_SPOFR
MLLLENEKHIRLHGWRDSWETGYRATCCGFDSRTGQLHICVIHKLLFRVWVLCICGIKYKS